MESMGITRHHKQPLAYRMWNPRTGSFFYSDVQPELSPMLDRWTGFFDQEGAPIYERDILRVHYDWRLGWVRAVVMPDGKGRYIATATDPEGRQIQIGFYSFAESYRIGNLRQHPYKLTTAREQFRDDDQSLFWSNGSQTPAGQSLCSN